MCPNPKCGNQIFYVLTHWEAWEPNVYECRYIGLFSSRERAEEACRRHKNEPGFKEQPENFHIKEYEINKFYPHSCPFGVLE